MSKPAADQPTDLSWLLHGLIERVPHSRSALLLSSDGLVKAVHGLERDEAEHLAAVASGLYSLARSAGKRFDSGGDVRQIVTELSTSLLFVAAAGHGAHLAVLAQRGADASVLAYEMAMLIKSARPHLATPDRRPER